MSANENFKLAVQLRGEGIDETADDLSEVEGQFDETSEGVSDTADEMEGFASRFDGAFTAILAGLAVAATGLLAQVPVIGSVMRGLAEIVNAVAFQMDRVLRPVLQPVASFFFDIADAIFNLNGPLGTLVGVVGTVASVFALFVGTLGVVSRTLGILRSPVARAGGALRSLAGVVRTAGATLAGSTTAVYALAGALGALVGVLSVGALETAGFLPLIEDLSARLGGMLPDAVRDATLALLGPFLAGFGILGGAIRGFIQNLDDGLGAGLRGAVDGAQQQLDIFVGAFQDTFTRVISLAFGWGADIMREFADGIRTLKNAPLNAAQEVIGGITQAIGFDVRANDRMAERWGEDLMTHMGIGIDRNRSEAVPTIEAIDRNRTEAMPTIEASGGGDRDDSPSRPTSEGQPAVFLDGDRVDENLRRRRDRETSPRGRFGTGR